MRSLILFAAALFFLSSCQKNLVPYTYSLEQKYNLEQYRDRIQFYNSTDIQLEKNLDSVSAYIAHGKIKTVGDRKIETIFIKAGTKAGMISGDPGQTGFEKSDEYYLAFGPNPNVNGKFTIFASQWVGNVGIVHYGTEQYNLTQGKDCYLLVDMRKILKLKNL